MVLKLIRVLAACGQRLVADLALFLSDGLSQREQQGASQKSISYFVFEDRTASEYITTPFEALGCMWSRRYILSGDVFKTFFM